MGRPSLAPATQGRLLAVRQERVRLVFGELVEREQKFRLELSVQRPSEGFLRGLEDGAAVRCSGLGAAAQDDNVPHCAFRGLDGGKSALVATLGDLREVIKFNFNQKVLGSMEMFR